MNEFKHRGWTFCFNTPPTISQADQLVDYLESKYGEGTKGGCSDFSDSEDAIRGSKNTHQEKLNSRTKTRFPNTHKK